MRPILRPFLVFALNTDLDSYEKNILHDAGIMPNQYKQLQGMYKGQGEGSYLVDIDFLDTVLRLAKEYNQESILIVDEIRDASLYYIETGSTIRLGKFQQVKDTKGLDAFTIDLSSGLVYAAIPEVQAGQV
jgi:hypothetical protein